jgi:hypothetical protein
MRINGGYKGEPTSGRPRGWVFHGIWYGCSREGLVRVGLEVYTFLGRDSKCGVPHLTPVVKLREEG